MTIKFRPEIGNDEYIIICSFGGRRMSGLVVRLISTDARFWLHTLTHVNFNHVNKAEAR